jgi:hypothetical protein
MAKQLEFTPLSDYHDDSLRVVEAIVMWQDDYSEELSPREWDTLGEMVIRDVLHRNLSGDRMVSDEDMSGLINRCRAENLVWLPIYAYIHSGVCLGTNNTDYPFNCKWDTSFAGVIYAENEAVIEEYGDLSTVSRVKAEACFEAELKTYQQFISGDVYGFSTLDAEGDTIDSCGGFFGSDPMSNGMSEYIEARYHDLLKIAAENIKYE